MGTNVAVETEKRKLNGKTQNCIYCNEVFSPYGITNHQRYHCISNPDRFFANVDALNMKKRKRPIYCSSNSESNSNPTLTLLDNKKLHCCHYCGRNFPLHYMTNHLAYCLSNPDNMRTCQLCGCRIHKRGFGSHQKSCAQIHKQQQEQKEQKKTVAITTATAIGNNMEGVHNINNSSED